MGASTGIFSKPEVAVMVAIVLLTTLLTPLAVRGTFQLKSDDDEETFNDAVNAMAGNVAQAQLPRTDVEREGEADLPELGLQRAANSLQISDHSRLCASFQCLQSTI